MDIKYSYNEIDSTKLYYLYRHVRLDKDQPFYIGFGKKRSRKNYHIDIYSRAFDTIQRSNFWKRIINKTKYEVEIIMESEDKEFIKQKEIEFIKLYGRRNKGLGPLVNLTDGGDNINEYRSPESIKQQVETRHKNAKERGYYHTPKTIKKISKSNTGKTVSDNLKRLMSIQRIGRKHTEETKRKMSQSAKGKLKSEQYKINESLQRLPIDKRLNIKLLIEQGFSNKYIKCKLNTSSSSITKVINEYNINRNLRSLGYTIS